MKKIVTFGIALLCSSLVFSQNVNIQARGKLVYPNETCANIWGYAANGNEYALVGAAKGLSIVDVTNPDMPTEIVQIPGPNDLWKEVKTLGHYAYVTSEGGNGLQIIDLSALPSATLNSKYYTGDGAIAGQLNTIHALHVDTVTNFVYLYGSNIGQGGAVVLDLTDPWNPTHVLTYDALGYIHDGYVDNDTLYGSHIYAGFMSIVDMTDKSNPVNLGVVTTPNAFTHNTWISEDRKTVFTTDEVDNSFLASFDVSDPTDIQLLDKIQSNPGSNSMVHNTHVFNNYAVTSWYADGVTIVDVTNPNNLVQVGNYDIAPSISGGGSNGCWGVYPYLPSGNLIATNIFISGSGGGELVVLTPTYERACYLEGTVTELSSGLTLPNALVEIVGGDIGASEKSNVNGAFKLGQLTAGDYQVRVSKPGYRDTLLNVTLAKGQTVNINAVLGKGLVYNVSANTVLASDGSPLPDANVVLIGAAGNFEGKTDAAGQIQFQDVFAGTYQVVAGAWGFEYDVLNNVDVSTGTPIVLELKKGYKDDFIFDYNWTVTGTSQTGIWERGEPKLIDVGIVLVPGSDMPGDVGTECYITGNAAVGVGEDAVQDGTMYLTSPIMDLTTYNDPIAHFSVWFSHITINQTSSDSFKVYVSNGTDEALIASYVGFSSTWRNAIIKLKDKIAITDNMQLIFRAYNDPSFIGFDSYEALVDRFFIREGNPTGTFEPDLIANLQVAPNPFVQSTTLAWDSEVENPTLRVYDVAGKVIQSVELTGKNGIYALGANLPKGLWFVRLEANGRAGKTQRIVKM